MKRKEVFWGLLFIFAAVLIVLNQFVFISGINTFDIVLTIIFGGIIIKSIMRLNFWGILFPIAFLCILYSKEWHMTGFTPWPVLLTALLLSIGLSMIFKNHNYCFYHRHHINGSSGFSQNIIDEQDGKVVNCSGSLGEFTKYVKSDDFKRANIKCSLGEMQVYFDNAIMASNKADIYLDVSLGNAGLYIPKSWNVVNDLNVFLGNVEDNYSNSDPASPTVTIHGKVSMANVEINHI